MTAPLSLADARRLLTDEVRLILECIAQCGQVAFTVDALVDAGVPAPVALAMRVDERRHEPVQARTSVQRRGRVETVQYIWAPDIPNYLRGWA